MATHSRRCHRIKNTKNNMYLKEDLEKMEISRLMEIAHDVGVKVSSNDSQENVIYAILDKYAIDSAAESMANTKRKRTRITSKDKDKVYTVNGKEGKTLTPNLPSVRRNLRSTNCWHQRRSSRMRQSRQNPWYRRNCFPRWRMPQKACQTCSQEAWTQVEERTGGHCAAKGCRRGRPSSATVRSRSRCRSHSHSRAKCTSYGYRRNGGRTEGERAA